MRNKKNKRPDSVSSYEVARLAGVSQATVSRVFSPGQAKVASATRQKVLEATRELNYQPSIIARSLANNSTKIIAFICGRIHIEFFARALDYLATRLQTLGYTTLFLPHHADSNMEETLPLALQYKVDGIIIATAALSSKLATLCADMGTPVILFDRYSVGSNVHAVCLDNWQAGSDAAIYLIKRGHRRLGFLAGDPNASTNLDRQRGFIETAGEAGLKVKVAYAGSFEYHFGLAAAHDLLRGGDRPDGVFCAGDYLAAGFMDTAYQHYSLSIPDDVSVIGLTDSIISKLAAYNLTTIQEPVERMVDSTIDLMMEVIREKADNATIRRFPGTLIERGTVADRRPADVAKV